MRGRVNDHTVGHNLSAANTDIKALLLGQINHCLCHPGVHPVVGVDEEEIPTACNVHSTVACRSEATVYGTMDNANAFIL